MPKTNVLITGVAGFIGSNFADRLLKEGAFRVIGIDNLSYGVKEQIPVGVEFSKMDIRSPDIYPFFKDIDYVFNFAAKNCISDCQLDPLDTVDINIRGATNVLEASRRAGVKKVISVESSSIYEGTGVFPTPETEFMPESFYAISKLSVAYIAKAYSRFQGLAVTSLRYFCVYGPRQDYRRSIPPVFSAFIIKLLRGEQPVIYGSGRKRRDFVYIDDVNDFHLRCITDKRTVGRVFNLGFGKNYSINEIYEIIARMLGSKVKPIHKPDLPGEARITLADISAAKRIGWSPKVPLQQGLEASIEYIRNEMAKGKIC